MVDLILPFESSSSCGCIAIFRVRRFTAVGSSAIRSNCFALGDSVLRVRYQPDRSQPLLQTKRAVLEDGSDFQAELLFWRFHAVKIARIFW